MTVTKAVEAVSAQIFELMDRRCNAVEQQMVIEIVTARHALRMGAQAGFVAAAVHKHVVQLLSGPALSGGNDAA